MQWSDDARLEIEGNSEPQKDQEQIDGPLDLRGIAVVPKQEGTQADRRKTSEQSKQSDTPLEFQTMTLSEVRVERGEWLWLFWRLYGRTHVSNDVREAQKAQTPQLHYLSFLRLFGAIMNQGHTSAAGGTTHYG